MITRPVFAVCFARFGAPVSMVGSRAGKNHDSQEMLQIPMVLRLASFAILDEDSE